jgi:predicted alpha/beta-fold hydrolase
MDDVPSYCRESDFSSLSESAFHFIQSLELPKIHPRCTWDLDTTEDLPLSDSEMESYYFYEKRIGILSQLVTYAYIALPALMAMTELWFRLLSFAIAPLVLTYLLSLELRPMKSSNDSLTPKKERYECFVMLLGIGSSLVLFTDSSYVHSHGRWLGGLMLGTIGILSLRRTQMLCYWRKRMNGSIVFLLLLTLYLYLHSDPMGSGFYDHPGIDVPTIQPGLYFNEQNPLIHRITELWSPQHRTYDASTGMSPFPTGDAYTGIPFLVNPSLEQTYVRVWVPSEVDNEAVALDIAFPPDGEHSVEKPVFLILHGLNGGSHEEYVRELVVRRTNEGFTCAVMIARGMMDTPVFGWNVFHGARISDVEVTAKMLRKALGPNQMLAGVGYSMGGIILSNYVARSSSDCHLDSAVAISAGLDLRENLNFFRSMRLWQPILAQTLKQDFIIKKFDGRFRQRLVNFMDFEKHLFLMRATSVSSVDIHAIVTYNGFRDLLHYYSEMSAMGDTDAFKSKNHVDNNRNGESGRIVNVTIPFLVLHALDDPITSWRTIGQDPSALTRSGSGNIIMLLTANGGHVGWPLGWNPGLLGWFWMSNVIATFVNSVDQARKEKL